MSRRYRGQVARRTGAEGRLRRLAAADKPPPAHPGKAHPGQATRPTKGRRARPGARPEKLAPKTVATAAQASRNRARSADRKTAMARLAEQDSMPGIADGFPACFNAVPGRGRLDRMTPRGTATP